MLYTKYSQVHSDVNCVMNLEDNFDDVHFEENLDLMLIALHFEHKRVLTSLCCSYFHNFSCYDYARGLRHISHEVWYI